ncbi:UbiH/UbiF/VisC/COQ6 family ubiquinone biosynthesis hydroxylase [Methylococcus sp. EFPC2]|uniref:UbiH/UbiF/VisC/COQ6 family ubiquinone biosynthesis hydroxylase n=1 Tax=Methylococcus sp. EFPC2 TaxID=2812648 RepID=UPI00196883C9|nr:UbiH/UbiF/VisC/COQ6 family ubiquinone biosynthesis hydroxylase [Methylococcus sp. EFPC2]QSA98603.1 UbiH/UbiF/VisC/COQ6 family ubiquinone biosynthesis hydroxylase [Methylococcus sp. EFPC2]
MTEHYDVVIVGGGMVGATLACSLGDSPLKIAIIEDAPPPDFAPDQPHDLRVSAISIASANILKTVGAWRGIVARRLCPFRRMRVWEDKGDVEFRSDDINEPLLGHIVENRIIQLAVLERLHDFRNITLLCPARTRSIEHDSRQSTVTLDDGRVLTARLLVAADGGYSRVRQAAGMGVSAWDYEQHALVLTVETAYPQQDITWQRFTPTGPLAFLPLDGPHASLVWYQTPEEVKRLKALPDEALLAELLAAFPSALGDIKRIEARGSFPLKRQHAQHYIKEGVALIGDAAHMIHPLAGQGVNIGLLDAAALAQVLLNAKRQGLDLGAEKTLREYEKMRRQNNLLMMTTMDLFYRVFGNTVLPLKFIRNLGLGLAERLSPAKKIAMRYAMGLGGRLPRLARGEAILG